MGEVQRSVQSNTYLTKGFLLVGWFTMKGFCDFSRYEETQRLDNYLKTCSPVSLEHRVPHFLPWIPLRGCWRSTAAAAKGSIVTVQFSHSVMSDSLQPHGLQHARLPCPSLSPGVCSNSCTESVIPSNHLILFHPLLLLPSIFPSIRVFSNELALCIRWPNYWSFSFSISPSNKYSGLISFRSWFSALAVQKHSRVFSRTTIQKNQFFGSQPSLWSSSHNHIWLLKNHSFDWLR